MTDLDPEQVREDGRTYLIQDECRLTIYVFQDNFSELQLLHKTIEDLISREESRDIESIAEHAEHLSEAQRSGFWAEEHPYWWEDIIAPQFRGAFFAALMSAVELYLQYFSRDNGTIVRAPISADDLKGGFYQRVHRFLEKVCRLKRPEQAAWDRIGNFYAIRNAIVHQGGFINDKSKERRLRKFAEQVDGLVIENGRVELSRAFCELALVECRAFLTEISNELVLLCRGARDQKS